MLQALIYLIIELAVVGLLFWLVTWALGQLPIPEPIKTVIRVLIVVVVCIVCIYLLLGFLPGGSLFPRRL